MHDPQWTLPAGPPGSKQYLLLCLLAGAPAAQMAREAARSVDWETWLPTVPPQLFPYAAFSLEAPSLRPLVLAAVWKQLAAARRMHAALHLRRQRQLRALLDAMARRCIPVLVLKGMALAHLVYPEPGLRPMADIDLLVPEERLQEASVAAFAAGYKVPNRWAAWGNSGPGVRGTRLQGEQDWDLLELHTAFEWIEPAFDFNMECVWEQSQPVLLGGIAARVPGNSHFLLHLCMHLGRHHRFQNALPALLDIHLSLQHRPPDWSWAHELAVWSRIGVQDWMLLCLALARDLLGTFFPPSVAGELNRLQRHPAFDVARNLILVRQPAAPPGFLVHLATESTLGKAGWLGRRLRDCWQRRPGEEAFSRASAAWQGWRRFCSGCNRFLVVARRAWREGMLDRSVLHQTALLEEERKLLVRLMEQRESSCSTSPALPKR
jgi:hypothetical protein